MRVISRASCKPISAVAAIAFLAGLSSTMVVTFDVGQAQAQRRTLLEQWFPRASERLRRNRERDVFIYERPISRERSPGLGGVVKPERKVAKVIPKVSGPSILTYKPEQLAKVSLASVVLASAPVVEADNGIVYGPYALRGEDDFSLKSNPKVTSEERTVDVEKTGTVDQPKLMLTKASLEGWTLEVESGIAAALKEHYSKDASFRWVSADKQPNANAKALLAVFDRAGQFGLDTLDYPISQVFSPNGLGSEDQLAVDRAAAQFELQLTAAALRYAADASSGRVNPNRLSEYHDFPNYNRDYSKLVTEIMAAEDPARTLESLNPSSNRFAALMVELAELRSKDQGNRLEPIAAGTFVKPGGSSEELSKIMAAIAIKASPELKEKHSTTFSAYVGTSDYTKELVAVVRDFQKENKLGPDGVIGKRTIAAMQEETSGNKIAKLEMSMERLRWLPKDLGQRHVFINQPAFTATYLVNDKSELSMRTVVGSVKNQTYFFSDTIETVEVNPYWNVPKSILVNEMLGSIRRDPGYLSARNYEVVSFNGKPRSAYDVDWYSESGINKVYIRQKPGNDNALGELKILFPNKHSIYMHDTPSKSLFNRDERALSHGCIRLHDPRAMAAAVLGTDKGQIASYIGGGENKAFRLKSKIPVHVAYFTAWPDDDGHMHYFGDVYGRDAGLTKAFSQTREMRAKTLNVSS